MTSKIMAYFERLTFVDMLSADQQYMQRCLDLALKGSGFVAPNPLVGAVLVCNNKIIGEGAHLRYGGPHAEVNCIEDAIKQGNGHLLSQSTLYVSLEPCSHHGKTPPCDALIISKKIPAVVIGCRDLFSEVNGKGIGHLKENGIEVTVGVLEQECKTINKRFFCQHTLHRPYIILKWAETADGFMGSGTTARLRISGSTTNMLVHRWRSEEAGIMVGSNTVRLDNPYLTNRSGVGAQPVRVIIDRSLSLDNSFHVMDGSAKTIILNNIKDESGKLIYQKLNPSLSFTQAICESLLKNNIQSVLIEGGAKLLHLFIESGCWDEARVITNTSLKVGNGVKAPALFNAAEGHKLCMQYDNIDFYFNSQNTYY
jgi:diaminohydroxyphosphoribosylaminopyrimidine deaminase/5-amino-6-(5-phosphoribosylamino)uracil reductase